MSKLLKCTYCILLLIIGLSCSKENEESSPINISDTFSECNSLLPNCTNTNGNYCLFGYKWGTSPIFTTTGVNVTGPKEAGGTVTYSFQEENGTINTHRQINLPSESFENLMNCAKEEIKNAFGAWSQIADIDFEELPENSSSDIRFFVADIIQSGIGYPNFSDSPCSTIKGTLIIQKNISIESCSDFYLFALHEIGHVLGLGHTTSESIMNSEFLDYDFTELQEGDKMGIIEIYGER